MASQSEKAKAHRERQALRSPDALGGIKILPGYPNRHARRLAASTNGKLAQAVVDRDAEKLQAALAEKPTP